MYVRLASITRLLPSQSGQRQQPLSSGLLLRTPAAGKPPEVHPLVVEGGNGDAVFRGSANSFGQWLARVEYVF